VDHMTSVARNKRRKDLILAVLTLSILAVGCFIMEYFSRTVRYGREGIRYNVSLGDIPALEYDRDTRDFANAFVSNINRGDVHSIYNMFSSELRTPATLTKLERIIKWAKSEFGNIQGLERIEKPPPDMPLGHSQNHFVYLQSELDAWKWGMRNHFKVRTWKVLCKEKGVYLLLILSGNVGDLKIVRFEIRDISYRGIRHL
jgi:hypothetical protein